MEQPIAPATDTPVAVPIPQLSGQAVLNAMGDEDRRNWRLTGKLPEPKPVEAAPVAPAAPVIEPDDDEADALPAAAAPSSAAPGAVAAAPVVAPKISKRQQQINDYERKLAAQREEIAFLRGHATAASQAPAPRTEPAPAAPAQPAAAEWQRYKTLPNAPQLAQFDNFEDWNVAMGVFIADQRFEERTARAQVQAQAQTAQQAFQASATSFAERTTRAKEKYPDFTEKTGWLVERMRPNVGDPVADRVFRSAASGDLIYLLATEPATLQSLIAGVEHLPYAEQRDEIAARIGRLEAKFDQPVAPAPPTVDPPKTLTSAPEPPVTLGSKPAAPADEAQAALARGDFAAYKRLQNAKELAARKQ